MKRKIVLTIAAMASLVLGVQSQAAATQTTLVSSKVWQYAQCEEFGCWDPFVNASSDVLYYSTRSDFNMRVCEEGNGGEWLSGYRAVATLEDITAGTQVLTLQDLTQDGNCVAAWAPGKVAGHVYKLSTWNYYRADPGHSELYEVSSETFTASY